jgi:hypothetical protein
MTDTEIKKGDGQGFFDRHQWVIVAILVVYVALLALGTVGELFKVDWILNLPIFKGP